MKITNKQGKSVWFGISNAAVIPDQQGFREVMDNNIETGNQKSRELPRDTTWIIAAWKGAGGPGLVTGWTNVAGGQDWIFQGGNFQLA